LTLAIISITILYSGRTGDRLQIYAI